VTAVARKRRRATARELPLDSPNWMPIGDAVGRVYQRTGDHDLVARDLTDDMAKPDGVRSMRRRVGKIPYGGKPEDYGPEREQLLCEFWAEEHELYWSGAEKRLMIIRRGHGSLIVGERGYAFFVWQPDLDKLYPAADATSTATPPMPSDPEKMTPEVKPPTPENPRLRAQKACREFADKKYPRGHDHIKLHVIMRAAEIDPVFRKTVIPFPKPDVWSRALDRRKG
jgi:hypothetical protein